jgi:hypothetical protein
VDRLPTDGYGRGHNPGGRDQGGPVRWEELFGDLEGQLEQADAAALGSEIADRTRRELARIRLVDRLRAGMGTELVCHVAGAGPVSGRVVDVGADWLLLTARHARESLVPTAALLAVTGLGTRAAEPGSEGEVAARLGLAHALRALARDRAEVSLVLLDGSTITGTVDRVGADFFDLAEHPPGELRRPATVRAVRSVPFAAVGVVRPA